MKSLLILLALGLTVTAWGNSPFQPHDHARFILVEDRATALEGRPYKYIQCASYEVENTLAAAATFEWEGIVLPLGSVITDGFFRIADTVVSADDNTIAVGCDTTNDLLTATDLSASTAGDFVAGAVTGAAATYLKLAAACTPVGTVGAGTSGVTAGKIELCIEYVPGL